MIRMGVDVASSEAAKALGEAPPGAADGVRALDCFDSEPDAAVVAADTVTVAGPDATVEDGSGAGVSLHAGGVIT